MMMALSSFRQQRECGPKFHGLAQAHPPVDRLPSMRTILDLDRPDEPSEIGADVPSEHRRRVL